MGRHSSGFGGRETVDSVNIELCWFFDLLLYFVPGIGEREDCQSRRCKNHGVVRRIAAGSRGDLQWILHKEFRRTFCNGGGDHGDWC